jgi:hypothetical protein
VHCSNEQLAEALFIVCINLNIGCYTSVQKKTKKESLWEKKERDIISIPNVATATSRKPISLGIAARNIDTGGSICSNSQ